MAHLFVAHLFGMRCGNNGVKKFCSLCSQISPAFVSQCVGHIKMTWFHRFCKSPPQKKKLNLQLTKSSAAYCLSNFS